MTSEDEQGDREGIEAAFPQLRSTPYEITSPCDAKYNCVAHAAGDSSKWWEPDPMEEYHWPSDVPREYTVEAYMAAFQSLGYEPCRGEDLEPEFQKIAIYSKIGRFTHVAKQLDSGLWTSKLGRDIDIEHGLSGLIGDKYGAPTRIMKRRM